MKFCKQCSISKPLSEFGRDKSQPDGKRFYCKDCNNAAYKVWRESDLVKASAVTKRWRENNPEKVKEISQNYLAQDKNLKLIKAYGISLVDYNNMLIAQNGVCYVCSNPPNKKALFVDHCHRTNKVRALLCTKCNTALGQVNDNIDLLLKLIKYLKDFND
jgi:hypothetical protein